MKRNPEGREGRASSATVREDTLQNRSDYLGVTVADEILVAPAVLLNLQPIAEHRESDHLRERDDRVLLGAIEKEPLARDVKSSRIEGRHHAARDLLH